MSNDAIQSPHQFDGASSLSVPIVSLSETLPMELVSVIIDTALIDNLGDDVRWCLSLSLVCRAFRASVLPIAYEVLFLDIKMEDQGGYVGWDGRPHTDRKLAFLSYLLHDPVAPPRQHVKHLIFRDERDLNYRHLDWIGPGTDSKSSEWPFEQLTVRYRGNADQLHQAGLRPRREFLIEIFADRTGVLPSTDTFERSIAEAVARRNVWKHQLTWPAKPLGVHKTARTSQFERTRVFRGEMNPGETAFISSSPSDQQAPPVQTVQLTDGDYLHQYPNLLLEGLAAVFSHSREVQIVLACNTDYRIAGKTVEEFIRAAIPAVLPAEALEGRLRVSHTAWVPKLVLNDFFYNLAQAMRRGGDPWDRGHGV